MSHYNHRNDALMLFVIIDELGSIKKVAIDFRDGRDILLNAYYWSHVYAKINYNKEFTVVPEPRTKLLSIPPSFAVKIYNLPQTIFHTKYTLPAAAPGDAGSASPIGRAAFSAASSKFGCNN